MAATEGAPHNSYNTTGVSNLLIVNMDDFGVVVRRVNSVVRRFRLHYLPKL